MDEYILHGYDLKAILFVNRELCNKSIQYIDTMFSDWELSKNSLWPRCDDFNIVSSHTFLDAIKTIRFNHLWAFVSDIIKMKNEIEEKKEDIDYFISMLHPDSWKSLKLRDTKSIFINSKYGMIVFNNII